MSGNYTSQCISYSPGNTAIDGLQADIFQFQLLHKFKDFALSLVEVKNNVFKMCGFFLIIILILMYISSFKFL